jgi:uncharacterized membrane protein
MPFNNKTEITDMERAELATWVDAGAKLDATDAPPAGTPGR